MEHEAVYLYLFSFNQNIIILRLLALPLIKSKMSNILVRADAISDVRLLELLKCADYGIHIRLFVISMYELKSFQCDDQQVFAPETLLVFGFDLG